MTAAWAQPWARRAACRAVDPALFAGEDKHQTASAKRLCAQCPVGRECLAYAIRTDSWGTWGGTTRAERLAVLPRGRAPTEEEIGQAIAALG